MIEKLILHKGEFYPVHVDEQDAPLLGRYSWHIINCGGHHGMQKLYVRRQGPRPRQEKFYLHREIMGPLLPGQVVDHLDANGLNCCRKNLRVTTQPDNARRQIKMRRACK